MDTHNIRFRKEVVEQGKYKEVYLYFLGRLIYKQWLINDVKVASRIFHEGEGLTQFIR